tara:strand:+ start:12729 stop:14000 length:1272 start_codon:yes stop_codon:yes gene_type:complete
LINGVKYKIAIALDKQAFFTGLTLMDILSITDLELAGKKVLVRVDYNVPINASGKITDDSRILASLPTIHYILKRGGKAILIAHLGRPKGIVEKLRLKPIVERLVTLTNYRVTYIPETIGNTVQNEIGNLKNGECLVLENVRFHPGEIQNNMDFARQLAKLGDIYINDAFGTAHRAHASTEGITCFLPERAAGFLMEKELRYLSDAINYPQRNFVVLLGGAKVSDKIATTLRFIEIADALIIGGGMAYTFLASRGESIGKSLVEKSQLKTAEAVLKRAEFLKKPILLPIDHIAVPHPANESLARVVSKIPDGLMGVDIGPETRNRFAEAIRRAKTILWNGPMGIFEKPTFLKGTSIIANEVATATKRGTISIIGGGDTAAAIKILGIGGHMSHISTGGGASLELLEGQKLPGILALKKMGKTQ